MNDKKKPYKIKTKNGLVTITSAGGAVRFPGKDLYAAGALHGNLLITLKSPAASEFIELTLVVSKNVDLVPHGSWEKDAVADVFAAKTRILSIQLRRREDVFELVMQETRTWESLLYVVQMDGEAILARLLDRRPDILDSQHRFRLFLGELDHLLAHRAESAWGKLLTDLSLQWDL